MGDSTFVPNPTGKLRKVLLCPPTLFDFRPVYGISLAVRHADLAGGGTAQVVAFEG